MHGGSATCNLGTAARAARCALSGKSEASGRSSMRPATCTPTATTPRRCAVGGNHEAANHLWELYHGGWAAPNIYFMGYAGVVNFGGLRIAGISGIWSPHHYSSGHYEAPPYDGSTVRSAYHVRDLEVYRLLKVCTAWPVGKPGELICGGVCCVIEWSAACSCTQSECERLL